jgi:hypothetical protein
MGLGVGLPTYPVKKKIVEKPPRNSAWFCGGQGLSWAVESQGNKKKKRKKKKKKKKKKKTWHILKYAVHLLLDQLLTSVC